MSVRIRLRRVGRKKQPYWRVVVVPRGAPRDGAYIEELGFYNPRTRPAFLTLDLEKLDEWIQNGAEISDSVKSLARKARKGGDDDVVYTKPGEEAPRLKTAKKPERRPKSTAAAETPEGMETTDEAGQPEPEPSEPAPEASAEEAEEAGEESAEEESAEKPEGQAEVKAAVETAEPAEEEEATEAQEEAETESEAVEASATEVEDADEAEEVEESEGEAEEEAEAAAEEEAEAKADEADEEEEDEEEDEEEEEKE